MRDARNLSISGRGGEERNLVEPAKKDTFFVARLLYREFAKEHTLNETVGRAQPFSIIALLDRHCLSFFCHCRAFIGSDGRKPLPCFQPHNGSRALEEMETTTLSI